MDDYLNTVINCIEGRIPPILFESWMDADTPIYRWLSSIIPEGKTYRFYDLEKLEMQHRPYNIREMMEKFSTVDCWGIRGSLSFHYFFMKEIIMLVEESFPQQRFVPDPKVASLYEMESFGCPDYIGGSEVAAQNIIAKILEKLPINLQKDKNMTIAQKRICEAFHVEGGNYPHWIQAPEWPVHNGKPMKFVKTVPVNSEFVQHHFVDPETGDERIVDDF